MPVGAVAVAALTALAAPDVFASAVTDARPEARPDAIPEVTVSRETKSAIAAATEIAAIATLRVGNRRVERSVPHQRHCVSDDGCTILHPGHGTRRTRFPCASVSTNAASQRGHRVAVASAFAPQESQRRKYIGMGNVRSRQRT